jgi:hypothetical protein
MSEPQSDVKPRVIRPVLAPFRGPFGGMTPVALRPPTPPNGRRTLPPFGAIRSGGPLPGAVEMPAAVYVLPAVPAYVAPEAPAYVPPTVPSYDEVLHEAAIVAAMEPETEADAEAEADGWYDGAESEVVGEPIARAMSEPPREAFEDAVRDLPLYEADDVPAAAAAEWAAFVGDTPGYDTPGHDAPGHETPGYETPMHETPTREWRSPELTPTPVRAMTPVRKMTPVRAMTPVRPLSPAEGSEVIGVVPSAANRTVATALESVAAQVRRGELVVSGAVPAGADSHSLAAALAAALGALLGVSR